MNDINPPTATASSTDTGTWHVEQNGKRTGPFTTPQVQAMIAAKQLTRDSLTWRPGEAAWTPLHQTPLASSFADEPPPLTGAAIPNGLVWVLAFAPLIGEFTAGLIAGITNTDIDSYWWVTLALNIVLSLMDERRLKAAGHDTKKMGGAWLVPVYLYKRSRVLKHNLAYFIVWVVCFVLIVAA